MHKALPDLTLLDHDSDFQQFLPESTPLPGLFSPPVLPFLLTAVENCSSFKTHLVCHLL